MMRSITYITCSNLRHQRPDGAGVIWLLPFFGRVVSLLLLLDILRYPNLHWLHEQPPTFFSVKYPGTQNRAYISVLGNGV
jgi:hypothetical protein